MNAVVTWEIASSLFLRTRFERPAVASVKFQTSKLRSFQRVGNKRRSILDRNVTLRTRRSRFLFLRRKPGKMEPFRLLVVQTIHSYSKELHHGKGKEKV